MAIVQISQITNRLGLQTDLPQLAGGELGWSTDTRQLYIGNGTLAQGAPVIGNTEILTEFSDIINIAGKYTYKGTAAGYVVQTGPTPGDPIVLSQQYWMDQWASVKDFGAKGDGVTDDTAAINRALNQLYCQGAGVAARRSLFFPAGVYKVSSTINIPAYATLYGEGPQNSVIQMINGGTGSYVAQTADSLQQTGINIGNNGAQPPIDINIGNMAFQTLDDTMSVFLVQSAADCEFRGVGFYGSGTTSTLTINTQETSGVYFGSTDSLVTSDILFDGCRFSGTVWGAYAVCQTKGIVLNNSSFNILYQGVALSANDIVVNGGPTGTRITNNVFDNICKEGIIIGAASLNASGYNAFYDVGNDFGGVESPASPIILIQDSNNISVGDMFLRSDAYSINFPQVNISNTQSIATVNGSQLQLGTKVINSGTNVVLLDNQANAHTAFTFNTSSSSSFKVDYSITQGPGYRTGVFSVSATAGIIFTGFISDGSGPVANVGNVLTVTETLQPLPVGTLITGNVIGGTTITSVNTPVFTGNAAGTILTVASVTSGTITAGLLVSGGNIAGNTYISSAISGSGGVGTYRLSINQTTPSGSGGSPVPFTGRSYIVDTPQVTPSQSMVAQGAIPPVYTDDYNQSGEVNVGLSAEQTGNTISIAYTSIPSTGYDAEMSYSISYFN